VDTREQLAEHLRFLAELGVPGLSRDNAWRARAPGEQNAGSPVSKFSSSPVSQLASSAVPQFSSSPVSLPAIREEIGDCTRCKLHRLGRRQIVFGVGSPHAALMFAGEAPGRDEDVQGIPFVGRAGQLLTKMIEAIGLARGDVYIANVIKCRPPENRNPEPDEVAACEPFLFRQVETIKPKVIVALGTFAAQTLLKTTDPISRLRGRVFNYGGAKLIPTFHPAYLLRSPERKRDAWEDLKLAKSLLP
jgi:uracil-DNA glycosylase